MFSTRIIEKNGFTIHALEDQSSGCFAEIVTDCGAALLAFGIRNDQHNIQIIDYYASKQEFDEKCESLGYKGCKLSPFVCRLRHSTFTFGNKEYRILGRDLNGHAIHGLIYNKRYLVTKMTADESHASVCMLHEYRSENKGFPFAYDCEVTWTLEPGGKLSVQTKITNQTDGLIPIQDGWHPYFNLGDKIDNLELEFQSTGKLVFDDELLPTGEKIPDATFDSLHTIGQIHLDNSFILDFQECQPLCVLRNKQAGYELQIYPSASYPILQIYTPDHRQSIAIENLSGQPNAFNMGNGFLTLEKSESTIFNTAYKINLL
ncbi:MAG: aldose 1-epimerase [Chitinophagaceae bacterium]|nr:aldose 1-epimerase [Chitinophagaceae bacterium]MCZ2396312.1 aldose 1-epimerase [Chitinophagales bacterium]